MAALRAEYAETLPERLEELSQAVRLVQEDPADDDRTRRVKALAHALRGTAGTFGFRSLSAAAGCIEEAACRRLERVGEASADGLADIQQGLAAACATLAPDA
jgi:HPt (histidine-containing phosphotransfer) domain-containing protein